MPERMTKSTLLAEMETGRQAWQALLDQIDEVAMLEPEVEGVWSVKEIIAHISGYEQYFGAHLIDLRQGSNSSGMTAILDNYYQQQLDLYRQTHPDFPKLLDDLDDDQLNILFTSACQGQSIQEVLGTERQAYERLLAEVQALSEVTLTKSYQDRDHPLIELIPNQCYAHYQMHMPVIEQWWMQRNR